MPQTALRGRALLRGPAPAETDGDFAWPEFDENGAPARMCYTSGTTGNPKGGAVLAPLDHPAHLRGVHRPTRSASRRSTPSCPIVPMFHANAWGVPYAATMVGAKLVFPGAALDGPSLYELIEAERRDLSARRADGVARPAEAAGDARHGSRRDLERDPRRRLGRARTPDRDLRRRNTASTVMQAGA